MRDKFLSTAFRAAISSACVLAAATAWAEVGTVAGAEGTAFIWRGGQAIEVKVGAPVELGDQLATGQPGRIKVVFQDDSVLTVSDDSRVTVDDQVFDASASKAHSAFSLLKGKVGAIVSDYYGKPGNSYEIKTETAVAGVRGTEFAMVYDPEAALTEVTGITGMVHVHSLANLAETGVLVTANESTTVARGQLPTAPRRVSDSFFKQRIDGFDFVGQGRSESLSGSHAIAVGNSVKVASAGVVTPGGAPGSENGVVRNVGSDGDATHLIGQPPLGVQQTGQLGIVFHH